MPFTSTQLHDEIINDPTSRGYAAFVTTGNDIGVANLLNEVLGTVTVFRKDVSPTEVFGATLMSGFTALTSTQQNYYVAVVALPVIDATNTILRTNIATLFPAGSQTRANLTAAAQRNGSRAEQLWGTGTVITALDVARALGRT